MFIMNYVMQMVNGFVKYVTISLTIYNESYLTVYNIKCHFCQGM